MSVWLHQLPEPLVSVADNFSLTRSGSVIPFIVTGDIFSRSVAEPISVSPPDYFSLTISNVIIIHGV